MANKFRNIRNINNKDDETPEFIIFQQIIACTVVFCEYSRDDLINVRNVMIFAFYNLGYTTNLSIYNLKSKKICVAKKM